MLAIPGEDSIIQRQSEKPGVVVHACNASAQEAEAGGPQVGGHYEQQNKLMSFLSLVDI